MQSGTSMASREKVERQLIEEEVHRELALTCAPQADLGHVVGQPSVAKRARPASAARSDRRGGDGDRGWPSSARA
jgi:hypothetical protein